MKTPNSLVFTELRKNMRLKYTSLFVFLFLCGHLSMAQEGQVDAAQQLLETADIILAETKVLTQARDYYEQAAQLDPENVRANYMTGSLYLQTTNKDKATKYLLRTYQIDPSYKFNLLYMIAQGYQFGYDFDTATDYYNQYKRKLEENTGYKGADKTSMNEVERRIYECENGKKYKQNPANYSIVNVGTEINSESWDYAPVVNADETVMVFTTRRQDGNLNENVFDDNFYYEDIFISKKSNGKWGQAQNIGSVINTKYHDSNLGFSPDGKTLYLYSDEGNGDIYYSNLLAEDTWSTPVEIGDNINSEGYNEKSVSQSADGNVLFFVSNRPGGYGGFDIYYSIKNKKGEWGVSKNIGDEINTQFDDDGPFIQADGKTLYFSSRGHDGMGGYDIYKTTYDSLKESWSAPENLGYPLNSPDDDIYFVMTEDGETGYYASVRDDGMGYNDIYRVTVNKSGEKEEKIASKNEDPIEEKPTEEVEKDVTGVEVKETTPEPEPESEPEPVPDAPVKLLVRVIDESGQTLNAEVEVKSAGDNVLVAGKNLSEGIYGFSIIRDQPTDFMLSVEKSGYIFQNKRITIPAAGVEEREIRETIRLRKPSTGTTTVLRNVYFEFGSTKFTIESYDELNKMVNFFEQNPGVKVEIAGHTDNIGDNAYNKKLSQLRANKVVNYLTKKGIDKRRVIAKGYGEERPIVSNDDEVMGREINRRVEFKILN